MYLGRLSLKAVLDDANMHGVCTIWSCKKTPHLPLDGRSHVQLKCASFRSVKGQLLGTQRTACSDHQLCAVARMLCPAQPVGPMGSDCAETQATFPRYSLLSQNLRA